jgi:hypothetical protein
MCKRLMTGRIEALTDMGRDGRLRVVRNALTVAGLTYVVLVWTGIAPYAPPVTDVAGPMGDSFGYWNAWEGGLYDIPWLTNGAYVYSPAFAQLTWPLSLLPWPVWAISWTLASIGALFWMRVPYLIAFPPVLDDVLRGNVHIFMATAIVIGMRYSISWAFMFLTKVTPGIGVLWFAVRREWRAFGVAVGGTALIVAVSFAIAPDLWRDWIDLLISNAGASSGVQVIPLPLAARLAIAAVIIAFAGRTNRAWLLPVGVMLAMPNIWPSTLAVLVACIPLARGKPIAVQPI